MAANSSISRADEILLFSKIISGVNHNVTASILLGGQSTTAPQIVAVFTSAIQSNTDLDVAKQAYQQKLAAQQAAFTTAHTLEMNLKSYVYGAYGKENPVVAEFGFPIVKAAFKSALVKAGAAIKSTATRVARHTMGKKEKASIHGGVTPVVTVTEQAPGTAATNSTTPPAAK
jgi:hypothetical protein